MKSSTFKGTSVEIANDISSFRGAPMKGSVWVTGDWNFLASGERYSWVQRTEWDAGLAGDHLASHNSNDSTGAR